MRCFLISCFFACVLLSCVRNKNNDKLVVSKIYWLEGQVLKEYLAGYQGREDALAQCVFSGEQALIKVAAFIRQGDTVLMFSNEKENKEGLFIDYEDSVELVQRVDGFVDISGIRLIRPGFIVMRRADGYQVESECGDSPCNDSFRNKVNHCSKSIFDAPSLVPLGKNAK